MPIWSMFIYRDEVYNKESKEVGTAEIIIGKQRNRLQFWVLCVSAFEGQYTQIWVTSLLSFMLSMMMKSKDSLSSINSSTL